MLTVFCSLALWLLGISAAESIRGRDELFVGYSEKQRSESVLPSGNGNRIQFHTEKGEFTVSMMRNNAPQTAAAVEQMARQQEPCPNCRFYRNEASPEVGSLGPPYGLLQGSLAGLAVTPPREGNKVARRGLVCMIPSTKEFFIALSDHSEWGTAHTVWGEVEDMTVVDRLVDAAYHNFTHPDYGTVMRMMDKEIKFTISLDSSSLILS